jgi:hypothetical protein
MWMREHAGCESSSDSSLLGFQFFEGASPTLGCAPQAADGSFVLALVASICLSAEASNVSPPKSKTASPSRIQNASSSRP